MWDKFSVLIPHPHAGLPLLLAFLLASCSGRAPVAPSSSTPAQHSAPLPEVALNGWPSATRSPWPATSTSPLAAGLVAHCSAEDGALDRVAARTAHRLVDGAGPFDESELEFLLRAEGSPFVWPRSFSFEVGALTQAQVEARIETWLGKQARDRSRCGIADETIQGSRVIAVVTADALGDLQPLPTTVRPNSWLSLEAELGPGIDGAKVVVLGPRGAPHTVPTSFDGHRARASFSLDRAGGWIVQLVVSTANGPRPALEARVFAGVDPPRSYALESAPGERDVAGIDVRTLAGSLTSMITAARSDSAIPALARNATLDRIAQRHAEAMRAATTTAHDVGDADPQTRVAASGIVAKNTGENVAHGKTVARAHRAIWQSPSHRSNLLDTRYDALGVGVAVDPDGSVWVCELFATLK